MVEGKKGSAVCRIKMLVGGEELTWGESERGRRWGMEEDKR